MRIVDNEKGKGTNHLIKEGASLVTSAADILEEYHGLYASINEIKKHISANLNNTSATGDKNIKFDLIFVDPPYDYNVYEKILEKVSTLNLLNDNGIIVLEHSNLKLKETYNNLILYKNKKYGSKSVNIYKNN